MLLKCTHYITCITLNVSQTGCAVVSQLGFEPCTLVWQASSLPTKPSGSGMGILFRKYHLAGINTTQETYEQILKAIQATISRKCLEVYVTDIVFPHDNARSHITHRIEDQFACFGWEIFWNSLFSGFGTEWFLSLSSAKEITRWMPVHHWCAGQKPCQFLLSSTAIWVFRSGHAQSCPLLF